MAFNRANVKCSFDKLAKVMDRHQFEAKDDYGLDETGIIMVQTQSNITAKHGVKQIGRITSSECGELVTICTSVSATSNCVPPSKSALLLSLYLWWPMECVGASDKSGGMSREIFLESFFGLCQMLQKEPCDADSRNFDAHLAIAMLECAKKNGITLISVPPHTTHKLMPLDKGVFGPAL